MTLLSAFGIVPIHRGDAVTPCELAFSDISIVVPVKSNQIGVDRLLEACIKAFTPQCCPSEILLVDLAPHPFVPRYPSPTNWLLASMQFLALWWGYHSARPARSWSMPPSTPAWSTAPLTVIPVHAKQFPGQNSPEVAKLIDGDISPDQSN